MANWLKTITTDNVKDHKGAGIVAPYPVSFVLHNWLLSTLSSIFAPAGLRLLDDDRCVVVAD